jgi:glycerol uptake facilitator-like aquaporin
LAVVYVDVDGHHRELVRASAPASGIDASGAFGVEVLVTFLLVLVIVAVATDTRGTSSNAPLAIGGTLAAAILISGQITIAGVNPARAIGPMIAAGKVTDGWVYATAPLVGAVIAATAGRILRSKVVAAREAVSVRAREDH